MAAVNYLVIVNAFLYDALVDSEPVKTTDIAGAIFIVLFTVVNTVLSCRGLVE
jgi:drug/metabolite transporter (DMT)-like permease